MKRLGMWNRLAIVLIVLASAIAPTWIILAERSKILETNSNGYRRCLKDAFDLPNDGTLTPATCSENWFGDTVYYPGWTEWWQLVGVTFLLCLALYLMVWASASTVKWILRGRETVPPAP